MSAPCYNLAPPSGGAFLLARASRRCGELLRAIEEARGKQVRRDDGTIQAGAVPNGRARAATEAGLSERQRKTALRVANIPEDEFEEAGCGGMPQAGRI